MPRDDRQSTTKQSSRKRQDRESQGTVYLPRKNLVVFGAALASIAAGFALLAEGSVTAAPILLVAGYCVLVPVAILLKR